VVPRIATADLRLPSPAGALAGDELCVDHRVASGNIGRFPAELGVALPNVYRAIEPLVAAQVLVEFTDKKRDQLWCAPEVLEALDAFAARAGRRNRAAR
jgi:hypothetical protein